MSETGEFVRDTRYLDGRITADGRDGWPVLAGKYRLVVARGCPWANRTMIVRRLLGLEPALSMGICGPEHDWRSWSFDLFQTPGFGDTIDFVQTKQHYYRVHTDLNPTQIVPAGPDLSGWLTPHGRGELGGRPFGDGTPPEPPPAAEQVASGHGAVLPHQNETEDPCSTERKESFLTPFPPSSADLPSYFGRPGPEGQPGHGVPLRGRLGGEACRVGLALVKQPFWSSRWWAG